MHLSALAILVSLAAAPPETVIATPKIGVVEIYGLRRIPLERASRALQVTPGEALPRSKAELETRLESLAGIVRVRIEAVCCENGQAMLYAGVQERGAVTPDFRDEPVNEITLPAEVIEAYTAFTAAAAQAARDGETSEALGLGHSLMKHPAAREAQEQLLAVAATTEIRLRQILKEAAEPDQRAIAAYVLQYVTNKGAIVDDLQQALRDPDEGVRLNAMRALRALAIHVRTDPQANYRVPPTWCVELLNSLVLSDRLEASATLAAITLPMDDSTRTNLRERALPALLEMAQWQHLPHALPAFLLLGRVAGEKEDKIQAAWSAGARDKSIEAWRKTLKPR
jgi:hypothetical protein